jgi:hypothetical protein
MHVTVTHDQTKRSLVVKLQDGPVVSGDEVDQNRYRRRAVSFRADTLSISATISTVDGAPGSITVERAKLYGPQLKADGSPSDTLRCSATWTDNSFMGSKIDAMPAWLWAIVRNALTGSTEWTAEDPS